MNIGQCYAARWNVTESLDVAATATDNITLATTGNEQSDTILEIVPGISVNGNSGWFDLDMEYELQGVFFDKNHESNDIFHDLDARGNGELVEDLFYIDFTALYTQRVIDPTVSLPVNNLSITSNTSDVGSYSISPYFRNRFGQTIEGELRYRYDKVDNRDDALFDSTSRNLNADLHSLEGTQRLMWRLSFQDSDTRSDDGVITKYQRSSLDLGYMVNRRFSLLAEGGYERNEYENLGQVHEGTFGNVGILWQPARRTRLEARVGRRYFGKTGSVSLSHAARRWNFNLAYDEDFETSNAALLNRQGDTDIGQTVSSASDPAISTGTYLSKNMSLSATRAASKTTLNMRLYWHDRELQVQNQSEKTSGASIGWLWELARRTELNIESMWQRQEMEITSSEIDDSISSIKILHSLSRSSKLSFAYRYQDRKANVANTDYEQNSYTIEYNKTF